MIKPSKWFYIIGIIVLISGPIITGIFLFSSVSSTMDALRQMPSIQVVVPGKSDITLSQTGKYTIFYEYESVVNNKTYSTGERIPGIQVHLLSKDIGSEIPLSTTPMSSTYTINGRSGVNLFDFTIDKPGIYELSASYPSTQEQKQEQQQKPEIVLSILHISVDKMTNIIMGTVASASVIFFVPFIAGIVIIVITFLKRRKATKAMH